MKNYLWERDVQWMDGCKGKKKVGLFDLWQKASAMKQIKLASSAEDRIKLLEHRRLKLTSREKVND